MRSLLPQFIIFLLLLSTCHRPDDEFVPVPSGSGEKTAEQPPEITDDNNDSSFTADSLYYKYRKFKDMPYRLLLPRSANGGAKYPLLVFLHGIGERGSDNRQQLEIGASYFARDSIREIYPAFVIYPQCPTDAYWFDSKIITTLKALVDSLQQQYNIDKDHISIGGFSMGAYGTFEITSRYPGYFEAALAISGDGDEDKAKRMAESRWKIFAGKRDDVVPSSKSKKMAAALERAGASVSFTLYPQADHGSTWVLALSEPDLFEWLFPKNSTVVIESPIERETNSNDE